MRTKPRTRARIPKLTTPTTTVRTASATAIPAPYSEGEDCGSVEPAGIVGPDDQGRVPDVHNVSAYSLVIAEHVGENIPHRFRVLGCGWTEGDPERLTGFERHGAILRAMTELRTIRPDGSMCLDFTGPLAEIPNGVMPWFSAPLRKSRQQTILFGHWAALGFYQAPGILALDSGCAWGGLLTAVRLEDNAVFQQPNVEETPR